MRGAAGATEGYYVEAEVGGTGSVGVRSGGHGIWTVRCAGFCCDGMVGLGVVVSALDLHTCANFPETREVLKW